MNHLGTVTLETERLILRQFAVSDASDMFRNWASDLEVVRFLTWPAHQSVEFSKQILEEWMSQYEDDKFYNWCIELKEIGEAIGSISCVNLQEKNEEVEIGYAVGRMFWKQGIMTEALKEVMRFFFEDVKANRIELGHDVNNPASGKVMRKCGLKQEAVRRLGGQNNTGLCDMAEYGLIRDEWEKEREPAFAGNTGMLEVVYVRHGEPNYETVGRKGFVGQGRDLAELTEQGRAQAELMARDPRLLGAEVILCSPYTRALQTAIPIAVRTGLEVLVETGLHEWIPDKTFQMKDGMQAQEACSEYEQKNGIWDTSAKYRWETPEEIRKRVFECLKKYRNCHKIIVVTHSMVMREMGVDYRTEYCGVRVRTYKEFE